MHPSDRLVSFEDFESEIQKLEELLADLRIQIPPGADVADQARRGFAVLYYHIFADERPIQTQMQTIKEGATLAGLGDIAAKINRAGSQAGFNILRPHLVNMVKGAVLMNSNSSPIDQAADKNSELYVGCLAVGAGMAIELEDPIKSGDGKNPDILLKRGERSWSIAVKTSHSSKPNTIFGNIRKAVEQIDRSERHGIVFVNLKNVIDHGALAQASPFQGTTSATKAVKAQVDTIVEHLRSEIVHQDWIDLFTGSYARPLVAFMAQVTVSAVVPGLGKLFVPVKILRAPQFPPALPNSSDLIGVDAEARALLIDLNEELQKNPPS